MTDYEVTNSRGVVVFTSPDKALAIRWLKSKGDALGKLHIVEAITQPVLRRIVYRPQVRLVEAKAS